MGQAKMRGTFEERQEEALQRKERATEEARNMRPLVQTPRNAGGRLALLMAASILSGARQ